MKAFVLNETGDINKLVLQEIEKPIIADREVLVKVRAISINPVDVKARGNEGILTWLYKDQRPVILGWDISGDVVEVGNNARNYKEGDAVFGMVNFPSAGNAYAEYIAIPENQLALKPLNISYEEAAAATLAALTAWQALVNAIKIKKGDRILIHAASGGVGHFAVQIAKHFGAYVIGTSSATNRDFILSLGADEHIDYRQQDFEKQVNNLDAVVIPLPGDIIPKSLKILKPGGIAVNLLSGEADAYLDLAKELEVQLTSILVHTSGDDMQSLADLLSEGAIKAHIHKIFNFNLLPQAHQEVETGRTVGKVVINI